LTKEIKKRKKILNWKINYQEKWISNWFILLYEFMTYISQDDKRNITLCETTMMSEKVKNNSIYNKCVYIYYKFWLCSEWTHLRVKSKIVEDYCTIG